MKKTTLSLFMLAIILLSGGLSVFEWIKPLNDTDLAYLSAGSEEARTPNSIFYPEAALGQPLDIAFDTAATLAAPAPTVTIKQTGKTYAFCEEDLQTQDGTDIDLALLADNYAFRVNPLPGYTLAWFKESNPIGTPLSGFLWDIIDSGQVEFNSSENAYIFYVFQTNDGGATYSNPNFVFVSVTPPAIDPPVLPPIIDVDQVTGDNIWRLCDDGVIQYTINDLDVEVAASNNIDEFLLSWSTDPLGANTISKSTVLVDGATYCVRQAKSCGDTPTQCVVIELIPPPEPGVFTGVDNAFCELDNVPATLNLMTLLGPPMENPLAPSTIETWADENTPATGALSGPTLNINTLRTLGPGTYVFSRTLTTKILINGGPAFFECSKSVDIPIVIDDGGRVGNPSNAELCDSGLVNNYNLYNLLLPTTFDTGGNWTATGQSGLNGFINNSAKTVNLSGYVAANPIIFADGYGSVTLTFTYSFPDNGTCTGMTGDFPLTIYEQAESGTLVNPNPLVLCADETVAPDDLGSINLFSFLTANTFTPGGTWTVNDGINVVDVTAQSTNYDLNLLKPTIGDPFASYIFSYSVTSQAPPCTSPQSTEKIVDVWRMTNGTQDFTLEDEPCENNLPANPVNLDDYLLGEMDFNESADRGLTVQWRLVSVNGAPTNETTGIVSIGGRAKYLDFNALYATYGASTYVFRYTVTNVPSCPGVISVSEVTFTILDDIDPPVIDCAALNVAPYQVTLGAGGTYTIDQAEIDNIGFVLANVVDNCDPNPSLTLSMTDFDCTMVNTLQKVTLTATDGSGNAATCDFQIEVVDTGTPVITCAPNTTLSTDPGLCERTIVLGDNLDATFTDNCIAGSFLTNDYNGTATIVGETFTPGTYTIEWTVTNGTLEAKCSVDITIADTEVPVIDCTNLIANPPVITLDAVTGLYTIDQAEIDAIGNANTTDNCDPDLVYSLDRVDFSCADLTVGQPSTDIPVTLTAEDDSGNVGTCDFSIRLRDDTVPTFTCPADRDIQIAGLCEAVLPDYTAELAATDNCSVTVVQIPAPGTFTFTSPGQQLPVTFLVSDPYGNSDNSCSFTVTAVDDGSSTVVTASNNSPKCFGDAITLTATPALGVTVNSYQWVSLLGTSTAVINNPNSATTTVTGAVDGEEFQVTLNFAGGCTSVDSTIVDVNPLPNVIITSNDPICENEILQLTENGGDAVIWQWTLNSATASFVGATNTKNVEVQDLTNGDEIFVEVIDVNGCVNSTSIIPVIDILPNAGTGTNFEICETNLANPIIDLNAQLTGAAANGTWSDDDASGALLPGGFVDSALLTFGQSYNFSYIVISANCAPNLDKETIKVRIDSAVEAGTFGANPLEVCESDAATLSPYDLSILLNGETPGGTWVDLSGTGALGTNGLLNLTLLAPGTYQFRYDVNSPLGICPSDSETLTVNIGKAPNSGNAQPNLEVCEDIVAFPPFNNFALNNLLDGTQEPGGVWTDQNGVTIPTGIVDISILGLGLSQFDYSVTGTGACSLDVSVTTVGIKVDEDLQAGVALPALVICETDAPDAPYSLFDLLVGEDVGGTWRKDSNNQLVPSGVINLSFLDPGKHTYTYFQESTGACLGNTDDEQVTIIIGDALTSGTTSYPPSAPLEICETNATNTTFSLFDLLDTGTFDFGGVWTDTNGVIYFNGILNQTVLSVGLYEFTYTVFNVAPCDAVPSEATVVGLEIGNLPFAGNPKDLNACATGVESSPFVSLDTRLTGADFGGVWTDDDGSGALDINVVDLRLLQLDTPYRFSYEVAGSPSCGPVSDRTTVTITVASNAVAGEPVSDQAYPVCLYTPGAGPQFNLFETIAGYDLGGIWYDDENTGALDGSLINLEVLGIGEFDFTYVQNLDSECPEDTVTISVAIIDNFPPNAVDRQIFCLEDEPTVELLEPSGENIRWYANVFDEEPLSKEERLLHLGEYYAALYSPFNGCESKERTKVTVELVNCFTDLVIPTVFSPNGDGINDTFIIKDLRRRYPNYELEVFTREGTLIYRGDQSSPDWDGATNEGISLISGKLPAGVYYWVLDFRNGRTPTARGYVYLAH